MHKEVRNIFLTLIGTIVLIVVVSLFTEIINISLSGIQLQQKINLACSKSMTLFSQETYKERSGAGTISMKNLMTCDGNEYISGKVYNGATQAEIYKNLYFDVNSKSDEFNNWSKTYAGNWRSISLLYKYLSNGFPAGAGVMPIIENYVNDSTPDYMLATMYAAYDAAMKVYNDYKVAQSYAETYMTPLNFGVPYMDSKTVDRMFQWNLTQILTGCSKEAIVPDESTPDPDDYYVQINGFRVYANKASVTLTYKVYDLTKPNDCKEFQTVTNIAPDNLNFADTLTYLGTDTDERQKICIVGVEYVVPIAYGGITPIKNIFNYVWNTEVEGYKNSEKRDQYYQYTDTTQAKLSGGGLSGNTAAGVLPVPGKLTYYVVR